MIIFFCGLNRRSKRMIQTNLSRFFPSSTEEAKKKKSWIEMEIDSLPEENKWKTILQKEGQKASNLFSFLDNLSEKDVLPPRHQVFEAFRLCPFDNVKVVILGQDPYHGKGQAHGLSFSVVEGVTPPPSLKNIFKEATSDLNILYGKSGELTSWAKQGVLLLNSLLTVEVSKPMAHQRKGWEEITDACISLLSKERKNIVFMLWGKPAQEKGKLIDKNKHFIITTSHPSPLGANSTTEPFLGSKCFSRCNEYLKSSGLPEIDWSLPYTPELKKMKVTRNKKEKEEESEEEEEEEEEVLLGKEEEEVILKEEKKVTEEIKEETQKKMVDETQLIKSTTTTTTWVEEQIELLDSNNKWKLILKKESLKAKPLFSFLEKLPSKGIFPPRHQVFEAFRLCPFDNVKVVILGQDPYHGKGQAHGLSFSVVEGVTPPPSLKNIFKEAASNCGTTYGKNGDLSSWAKQGVLLLNSLLTVEESKPMAHKGKGWEKFTDACIASLSKDRKNIVFMLWGKPAQEKGKMVDKKKHFIITTSHPSPLGANSTNEPFLGSKCFARCNEYLKANGLGEIDWKL